MPSPGVRVDANFLGALGIAVECVTELPVSRHLEVVQRRESLAPDSGGLSGDVKVVLHHGQCGMAQVLLQKEDVPSVQEEHGGVSVAEKMGMEPVHSRRLGQAFYQRLERVRRQRVSVDA